MRLGPMEIGLILVIVLIVFGVGKMPQIGGAMGKSIREFKKARDTDPTEVAKSVAGAPEPPAVKS